MDKKLVIANWKMNIPNEGIDHFLKSVIPEITDLQYVQPGICPPYLFIPKLFELLDNSSVLLGAQNLHYEDNGAFTGEISAQLLKTYCSLVIIGHSERRRLFHETGEEISRKIQIATQCNLTPILCVGENITERKNNLSNKIVTSQLITGLSKINNFNKLIVAYEPLWAIGSGNAATPNDIELMVKVIRQVITERFGIESQNTVRIIYGGSVSENNITKIITLPNMDGVLVGNASLDPLQYSNIVKNIETIIT